MRCFLLPSFITALLALNSLPSSAQDHVKSLLGVEGGYNFVSYRSDAFPVLNSQPNDFMVQNGSGRDIFWGASYEDPLSSNMHHFLILEGGFDSKNGDFSSAGENTPIPFPVYSNEGNSTYDTGYIVGTHLQAELSYLYLNVGYKFNLEADSVPNGLGIQLCLELGMKLAAALRKSVSSRFFNPDTSQTYIFETAINSSQAFRLALRPELTYDIPLLNNHFVLTPFIGYDAPLTQVDQPENWTASSIFSGLSLHYAFW